MTEPLRIFVPGKPETKGSARAFVVGKRAVVTNDNPKAKKWQASVRMVAEFAMGKKPALDGPVKVSMRFQMDKPKSVKRTLPSVRPDLDKLIRCCLDGLSGVVFGDDCQVVELVACKAYGEPGVVIDVDVVAA